MSMNIIISQYTIFIIIIDIIKKIHIKIYIINFFMKYKNF